VADRPNHHFRSSTSLFRVKGRSFQFGFNRRQLHDPLSFQFWLAHARRALVRSGSCQLLPDTTIDCARATRTDLRRSAE